MAALGLRATVYANAPSISRVSPIVGIPVTNLKAGRFILDSAVERGCRVQLLGSNASIQKRGLTRWAS